MESVLPVCLGYRCPMCGQRVAVLRSTDPATEDLLPETIKTKCLCGYKREVIRDEIGLLDIWREKPQPLEASD